MTIELADFFVFRTPLLPFSELTEWARGLRAPAAPDMAALEAAIADDRRLLLERLREVVVRPVVREALFLASPSLHDRLPAWTEHADKGRKVEQALVKYFTRMAARATPFGLFAGNTVATSGPQTHLLVEAARTYKRRTRLDCEYLSKLTDALGQDPTIRNAFAYRPNSSLYRMAGQLRCIRIASAVGGTGALSATTATKPLEATLARAAKGAHPGALADSLVSAKVSRADADKYLESLVRCQILVSELAVPATGAEPLADLVGQLSQRPETTSIARVLERVRTQLAALDAAELGLSADTYRAVAKELEPLPVKAELGRLFQVDMVKPSPQARLGARVREELARGTELLHRIAGMPDDQRLLEFCRAFERRYGDREMPLCAVLDEELGIGFDSGPNALSPLLSDLDLEQGTGRHARPPTDEPQALSLLAHKVEDALRAGAREICLDETDLRKLERKDRSPLPDAGAVFARLAAASDEALDAGDFLLHIGGASGPSGANLLGRFCHGDEMLTRHVRRHLADEEARHPDVLFAEVVHIPQARLGNVTLRPLLRSHEIAYLGRSGAPEERHIAADDLLVSVRGERVILRSRRLGREIAPRLTSAHNHSSPGNLAMYRFLCALQTQGVCPAANFDWGALNCLSFLPRVRAGRIVLSLARWIVSGSTLKALGDAKGAGRYALVQELRRTRNLPRWVAVADWDNELPIDLDNTLSIDTFVAVVKDRANVALTEVFEPEQLCARGPEGRFVHELVVPFLSKRPAEPARDVSGPAIAGAEAKAPRVFRPGSEWLYAKLYTGPATADRVLLRIEPVVRRALASGAADSWFFIRYGDPDCHVRLRLHGDPSRLLAEVLADLGNVLDGPGMAGQVWKMQLDTYDREIERYGGDEGILLSEQVSCADSEAVLSILQATKGGRSVDARWRLALRGMDMLLDDLGFDLDAKRALARDCRAAYGKEHKVDAMRERQLGQKFRKERPALEALLAGAHDGGSELMAGVDALRERSRRLEPVAAALRRAAAAGRLMPTLAALASSYLHMFVNRSLREAQQAQELVLYDFLSRLYESQAARRKGRAGAPQSTRDVTRNAAE